MHSRRPPPRTTLEARIPGAFEGETVTRRRLMTGGAHAAGAIAAAAFTLPALGFALGPVFERTHWSWQAVGEPADFPDDGYVPKVIVLDPNVGEAGRSTVFVRRRNPAIDLEPADRWNRFVAISSRCAHVGCPVDFVAAAGSFICPCHGGVYDFRGIRVGGPPPRPLDRFFTRVSGGQVQIGPRYSVNNQLRRFSPRDPGEPLDGIGQYLYPARPTTPRFPK
jgi:menaquinol-cytochrome c reductase iron-sulfur subunit